jgi:membrane protease YdiL (CAAX protease family)
MTEPVTSSLPEKAAPSTARRFPFFAWALLLLGSLLPDILFYQLTGAVPPWLQWARIALLVAAFLGSIILNALQPLRSFIAVLLTLHAGSLLLNNVNLSIPFLQALFGNGSFIRSMQPEQFNKLAFSLLMIVVLLAFGYRAKSMFLVPGNMKAPITPVKWLGFPKPSSWVSFGGQYSVYLALGVGAVIWLTSGTTLAQAGRSLAMLPAILVMAALNAFNEELAYRSAILATLEGPVGRSQAWLMAAALFGIGHFFGVPSGWVGILLATFMGWILSKAMLETRGFFWSWWIHFLQDVVIFFFLAAGTVTPGG